MKRNWEIWDKSEVEKLEEEWGSPAKGKQTRHQALLMAVSKLIEGSVLDVGCGLGHFYGIIRGDVKSSYLGVDSSPEMIKRAKANFSEKLFKIGSAYDLSEVPVFDTVVCIDVVKHVPETWPILEQLWSKAGKQVILVTNTGETPQLRKIMKNRREQGDGKYLIIRTETVRNLMNLFAKLPNVGKTEYCLFDTRKQTNIFRIHRGDGSDVNPAASLSGLCVFKQL